MSHLRGEVRAGLAALSFLTRIPVACLVDVRPADLARSAPAFPLVGGFVGLVVGAVALTLDGPLHPTLAASCAVVLSVLLTGGMHLDALADTADALGARDRDQALAVMRDPHVGSYGATAIGLCLLLEVFALSEALAAEGLPATVAVFALSRALAPALMASTTDVRRGGGLVGAFSFSRRRIGVCVCIGLGAGLGALGALGAVVCLLALVVGLLVARLGTRLVGGLTGDLAGVAVLLTEAGGLLLVGGA